MASRGGAIIVLALAAAGLGCRKPAPLSFGKSFDASAAVPLAELLSRVPAASGPVVTSGRISQVCRSSGCWFTLQDSADGRSYELLVDLERRASFTVPPDVAGRRAAVSGLLSRGDAGPRLDAEGLALP